LIEVLLGSLYDLVVEESNKRVEGSKSIAGHGFEDTTADKIVRQAKDLGLKPNPPRFTPRLPTLSGNLYQYDVSFVHNGVIFLAECKRRELTGREHVFYLGSRILDHVLGARLKGKSISVRGIFISTTDLPESAWLYALAYGITILEPSSPPIEWILTRLPPDSLLKNPLHKLVGDIHELTDALNPSRRRSPKDILKEYQYLGRRGLKEIRGE
jgi:hypothetical protein